MRLNPHAWAHLHKMTTVDCKLGTRTILTTLLILFLFLQATAKKIYLLSTPHLLSCFECFTVLSSVLYFNTGTLNHQNGSQSEILITTTVNIRDNTIVFFHFDRHWAFLKKKNSNIFDISNFNGYMEYSGVKIEIIRFLIL